jgi:hypothetical protein
MAPNAITPGGAARRALLAGIAALAAVLLASGCGGGDGQTAPTTTAVAEKQADAELLNQLLARQLGAVEAYGEALAHLRGGTLQLARTFRAQEQEHVDGLLKALRGLGEAAEPEPEAIEAEGLKSQADYLGFFYEIENATIEAELSALNKLTAPFTRPLLAATAANQAQHLVLLRRALGAKPGQLVPSPFETGTTPAP